MKRRDRIKAKFLGKCAYCGDPLGDRWHVDHKDAIVREMKWSREEGKLKPTGKCGQPQNKTEDNEYPACIPCNMNKSSLPLEYWRKQIASRLAALNERSTDYKTAKRFGLVEESPKAVVFWFEAVAWGAKFESLAHSAAALTAKTEG